MLQSHRDQSFPLVPPGLETKREAYGLPYYSTNFMAPWLGLSDQLQSLWWVEATEGDEPSLIRLLSMGLLFLYSRCDLRCTPSIMCLLPWATFSTQRDTNVSLPKFLTQLFIHLEYPIFDNEPYIWKDIHVFRLSDCTSLDESLTSLKHQDMAG